MASSTSMSSGNESFDAPFVIPPYGLPVRFHLSEIPQGVQPVTLQAGDIILSFSGEDKALTHAKRFYIPTNSVEGKEVAVPTHFDFIVLLPLSRLAANPAVLLSELSEIREKFTDEKFINWLMPRFMLTAGTPDDNRDVDLMAPCEYGNRISWSVPKTCIPGDIVFMWVSGVGFLHVFRSYAPTLDTGGTWPYQGQLEAIANIEPPISIGELREHPVLRDWSYVRSNMQGLTRHKFTDFSDEAESWNAFLDLVKPRIRGDIAEYLGTINRERFLERISHASTGLVGEVNRPPNSQKALGELTQLLPDFSRDTPSGDPRDDALYVHRDVHTLAIMIAAKVVQPPLAIGIFGAWGSGKSFIVKQTLARVKYICESARKSAEVKPEEQEQIAFYSEIYQIEFNAWHYSEGNLWASLVDHFFTELCNQVLKLAPADGDKQLKHLLTELDSVKDSVALADQTLNDLKIIADEAQKKYDGMLGEMKAAQKKRIEERRKDAWLQLATTKLVSGLSTDPHLKSMVDTYADVRRVAAQASTVQGRLAVYLRIYAGDKFKALGLAAIGITLFLAVFAGPLASWLSGLLQSNPHLTALSGYLSQISVCVIGVIVWINKYLPVVQSKLSEVGEFLQNVDAENARIESAVYSAQTVQNEELAKADTTIVGLKLEMESQLRIRTSAEERRIQLISQIEKQRPERLLLDFIEERANSKDYRQQLGVLALVRRDFEKLSQLLVEQRNSRYAEITKDVGQAGVTTKLPKIDRLVLYIDDLDRCSPKTVVNVLQAVHLLLAYDLFTVVVAVDPKWLCRALEIEHSELLGGAFGSIQPRSETAIATTADYLEKIFQIPFQIPDFSEHSSRNLIYKLISAPEPTPKTQPAQAHTTESEGPSKEPEPINEEVLAQAAESARQAAFQMAQIKDPQPLRTAADKLELKPVSLNITAQERSSMLLVAPIAGRSPRQVKRFLNLYRLIKVSLAHAERMELLDGGHEAVVILVAVMTTSPELSHEIFRSIEDPANQGETMDRLLQMAFKSDPSNMVDIGKLGSLKAEFLNEWLPSVERFSFVGLSRIRIP